MYYVYILLNIARTRTYTGTTNDIARRFKEHNAGEISSSRPYRPYELIHTESFPSLSEARKREKYFKSTPGRRKIREIIES